MTCFEGKIRLVVEEVDAAGLLAAANSDFEEEPLSLPQMSFVSCLNEQLSFRLQCFFNKSPFMSFPIFQIVTAIEFATASETQLPFNSPCSNEQLSLFKHFL